LERIGYFFKLRSKVEGERNFERSERIREGANKSLI